MNLFPAKLAPYAKAWVSLLGVVFTALTAAWPDAPSWVPIVGAVVASVAVYLTPNVDYDAKHDENLRA